MRILGVCEVCGAGQSELIGRLSGMPCGGGRKGSRDVVRSSHVAQQRITVMCGGQGIIMHNVSLAMDGSCNS